MLLTGEGQESITAVHDVAVHQRIWITCFWCLAAIQSNNKEDLKNTNERNVVKVDPWTPIMNSLPLKDVPRFPQTTTQHVTREFYSVALIRTISLKIFSERIRNIITKITAEAVLQSTVQKKMAAVHFTTIPCKPNQANRHIESHVCEKFVPVLTTLCIKV